VVALAAPAVAADAPSAGLPAAVLGTAPPPRGERVAYFPVDPAAKGYLAVPKTPGRHGGVILIHEWNGLGERVMQVADALADEGYVALAADLYSGRTGTSPEESRKLVQETLAKPELLVANLNAAAAFLRKRDDVTGRIGAVG
jgi:carboxymethylenebutenolidase